MSLLLACQLKGWLAKQGAPRIRNTTGESGSSEEIDGREQLDDMRRYFEDERDKFNEATAALIQEKLELQVGLSNFNESIS